MTPTIKALLESIDRIDASSVSVQHESADKNNDSLSLLESDLVAEWNSFKLDESIFEAPEDQGKPPGAAAPGKTVDPKTVATIGKIRAITKNLRLVPSVAGAAVAKQVAGIRPNPNELKQLGTLDQTIGAAAKQALLNPKQSGITLNAITQAARAAQAQQGKK